MTLRLLLAVSTLTACVAETPESIVGRLIEAEAQNQKRAAQYTYVEHIDHFTADKAGKWKKDRSETYDILFVEGETYRRLVERNDQPLSSKEKAKEDEKQRLTAEERRRARRSGIFTKTVTLGSTADLATLYRVRVVGEEDVRGRKAWVLECKPKEDYRPDNAREKQALSFDRKLWVDQKDVVILRSVYEVTGDNDALMPHSTISWEFDKVNDDAWMISTGEIDGRAKFLKMMKPKVRTEYRCRDFKKFDVQSTITPIAPD